nr:MAG TPA: hypothetical protein [Caudoviricetes sp.]
MGNIYKAFFISPLLLISSIISSIIFILSKIPFR